MADEQIIRLPVLAPLSRHESAQRANPVPGFAEPPPGITFSMGTRLWLGRLQETATVDETG